MFWSKTTKCDDILGESLWKTLCIILNFLVWQNSITKAKKKITRITITVQLYKRHLLRNRNTSSHKMRRCMSKRGKWGALESAAGLINFFQIGSVACNVMHVRKPPPNIQASHFWVNWRDQIGGQGGVQVSKIICGLTHAGFPTICFWEWMNWDLCIWRSRPSVDQAVEGSVRSSKSGGPLNQRRRRRRKRRSIDAVF